MAILHLLTNLAAGSSFIPYHLGTKLPGFIKGTKLLGFTLNVDEVDVDLLKKIFTDCINLLKKSVFCLVDSMVNSSVVKLE